MLINRPPRAPLILPTNSESCGIASSSIKGTRATDFLFENLPPAVELIHVAALLEFIDKAKIDKVLRFGFGGPWVRQCLNIERLLQTFERWVRIFNKKLIICPVGAVKDSSV